MFDRSRKGDKALLIHAHATAQPAADVIEEFAELARSAGAGVVAELRARIHRPNAATLIGSGKVEEAKLLADASDADLVLVDHALSPVQERNLEKALQRRVVDRTGLILDIFAQRARSHEGKLQVELAQLRHLATRLVRGWTHLERQRGGAIGLRGPGETQLETDRRLLQKRVEQLQTRLEKVEVQRTQMRRARLRSAAPRVALVGYTNAGKSTLFNRLTGADAYAADQLFATLDPTVRRLDLAGASLVLADTVGFVRDLPHELVAAFRSTLSEAREAELLLHVVDAADPDREERIRQVNAVLAEIGAGELPQVVVFNKLDRLDDPRPRIDVPQDGPARVWLSAREGTGLDQLRNLLVQRLSTPRVRGILELGAADARLRARLHAIDAVVQESALDAGWQLEIELDAADARRLAAEPGGAALDGLLDDGLPTAQSAADHSPDVIGVANDLAEPRPALAQPSTAGQGHAI